MTDRILELGLDDPDGTGATIDNGHSQLTPTPIDDMDAFVAALSARDSEAVTDMLARGRQSLQKAAIDELHRLVGQVVAEVALAEGLREKVGRAIDRGTALMQSRPPDHLLAQFADPEAFVARCRAVCSGLLTFLSGELTRVIEDAGISPVGDSRDLVRDAAEELRLSLDQAAEDSVDRKARIAIWVLRSVGESSR